LKLFTQLHVDARRIKQREKLLLILESRARGIAETVTRALIFLLEESRQIRRIRSGDAELFANAPVPSQCHVGWTSNGCAAGNTREEAILQGFLELVERDAAAIWWYGEIRRPAIDLGGLCADLGAFGVCSAPCPTGLCPRGSLCASSSTGAPRRCLRIRRRNTRGA